METLVFAIRDTTSTGTCQFVNRECEEEKNLELGCPPITQTYQDTAFNASVSIIRAVMMTMTPRPPNAKGRNKETENGWSKVLPTLKPKLLILNRGAHFVGDKPLLARLNETFAFVSKLPNVSIIWRATNTGHTNWKKVRLDEPLKSLADVKNKDHNWPKFQLQNQLVKKMIEMHYPHILFMDIWPSTTLRADLHPDADGLHYCMPGPIDNWVRLLHATLAYLASQ